ncbi:hypothetical protein [Gemmiger sp.]
MKKWFPVLLSAALLLSACGQTAESAAPAVGETTVTETAAETPAAPKTTPNGVDKSETVYAKANADGTVTETTVEAVLKARDGAIQDVAALRDIVNKEGDEEYTQGENNTLTWENHGTSITYEGKSDAALPVTTRVTYYLDGAEIKPDDLAGRSGRVRIRFDYTNHTRETVNVDGEDYTVCVPFTAVTAVILDGDKFTNIEADNGKVMELDGQTAVLGTAMPGLADSLRLSEFEPLKDTEIPAYFELTADVTDFSLAFTATILTPSMLDEVDLDDAEDLNDLDKLSDALDDLTDATDALTDGTGALADGVQALYDGFDQYAQGVKGVNEGAEALADGLTELYYNGLNLVDGANAVRDGLSTVAGAVSQIDVSDAGGGMDTEAVAGALTTLGGDAQKVGVDVPTNATQTAVANIMASAEFQQMMAAACADMSEEDAAAFQQQTAAMLAQSVSGAIVEQTTPLAQDIGAQVQTVADFAAGLQTLGDSLGQLGPVVGQLQAGLDQLASGSADLARGADTYIKAVGQASQGANQLAEGSAQLDDASADLYGGIAELHDGAVKLHDGVQEFSDKMNDSDTDLTDDLGTGLRNVVRRLRAVRQAGKNCQTFSGLAEGQTGSVKFIVETAEIK